MFSGVNYYGSEGEVFKVSFEFWDALRKNKIQYYSGGNSKEIFYSTLETLELKQLDFEIEFIKIAKSGMGELALSGQIPVTTIL